MEERKFASTDVNSSIYLWRLRLILSPLDIKLNQGDSYDTRRNQTGRNPRIRY